MKFILIILLALSLYAKDKVYFLPKEAKKAEKTIEKLIINSKTSIDIAMYNFAHDKFAKLLRKAKKRGVKVKVYYEKEDVKFGKVKTKKVRKKLHTKIAIFDKQIVVFGSANWTVENFQKNYEVLFITDKKKIVSKFNSFFKDLN